MTLLRGEERFGVCVVLCSRFDSASTPLSPVVLFSVDVMSTFVKPPWSIDVILVASAGN